MSWASRRWGRSLGGARRDRTADLLHAMQALSQLSYGPTRARQITVQPEVCQVNESDCFTVFEWTCVAPFHLISVRVFSSKSPRVCRSRHVEICLLSSSTRR